MYVSRRIGNDFGDGGKALHLLPLSGGDTGLVIGFDVGAEAGGEVFQVIGAVHGRWRNAPRFAVYGDWQIDPEGDPAGFEASRLALFTLRRAKIDRFHSDYLLQRSDRPASYTVLGPYGDAEGMRLCREHRAIRDWAQDNAPSRWRARDTSGARMFRIAGARF